MLLVSIEETEVVRAWSCGLREAVVKKLYPDAGVLGVVGVVAPEVGSTIGLGVGTGGGRRVLAEGREGTTNSALVAETLETDYECENNK